MLKPLLPFLLQSPFLFFFPEAATCYLQFGYVREEIKLSGRQYVETFCAPVETGSKIHFCKKSACLWAVASILTLISSLSDQRGCWVHRACFGFSTRQQRCRKWCCMPAWETACVCLPAPSQLWLPFHHPRWGLGPDRCIGFPIIISRYLPVADISVSVYMFSNKCRF